MRLSKYLIWCCLWLGACVPLTVQSEEGLAAGPLICQFPLTLVPGNRTEALGPFFYQDQRDTQRQWAIPPLISRTDDSGVDSTELDVLYPLLTYDRFGSEYRFQIVQLFAFAGGNTQKEIQKKRFTLFPLYFQQRAADTNYNYTALFPLYGTLKNRLFRDEIHFVLFPIYGQSRKKDVVTDNYLFPVFHVRQGNRLSGWQVWPLVGHEHKDLTTKTNNLDQVEPIGGHDNWFALWPVFFNDQLNMGTTNFTRQQILFPLYMLERSTNRDSTTLLWPLFTYTDDRVKKYHEYDAPWPLIVFARGESKRTDRIWPFFSHATNAMLVSDFYVWPVYKYNRAHTETFERSRTRILFFLYSDVQEQDLAGKTSLRRKDLWPLFTSLKQHNGNERLQILAPVEPFLPGNWGIERNYAPLWSLWRSEHNGKTGATSQSLLWNLYRRDTTATEKKCSLLFGLIQYESGLDGSHWRWLYLPAKGSRKPAVDGQKPVERPN